MGKGLDALRLSFNLTCEQQEHLVLSGRAGTDWHLLECSSNW
jgi:hypothetical protein